MTEVTTYELATGRRVWSGELDILVAGNRDGLTEEEVRRLEAMGPGDELEVGMGFRVVAAGRRPLRVIDGGRG